MKTLNAKKTRQEKRIELEVFKEWLIKYISGKKTTKGKCFKKNKEIKNKKSWAIV